MLRCSVLGSSRDVEVKIAEFENTGNTASPVAVPRLRVVEHEITRTMGRTMVKYVPLSSASSHIAAVTEL